MLVLSLFSLDAIAYSHLLWPEIPHLFFFTGALYFAVVHGSRMLGAAARGALLGLALLTKLVLLPFSPVIVLALFLCSSGRAGARGARAVPVPGEPRAGPGNRRPGPRGRGRTGVTGVR